MFFDYVTIGISCPPYYWSRWFLVESNQVLSIPTSSIFTSLVLDPLLGSNMFCMQLPITLWYFSYIMNIGRYTPKKYVTVWGIYPNRIVLHRCCTVVAYWDSHVFWSCQLSEILEVGLSHIRMPSQPIFHRTCVSHKGNMTFFYPVAA